MKKVFIVANPTSGKRKANEILEKLASALSAKEISHEAHLTTRQLNAWKIVERSLDASFTDMIVLGGDGTLNEAVNGLKLNIPVGIIAAGTGNDYVKVLDIGSTLDEQIETAISGQPKPVDLGSCNGRKFLNGVGVGFDGQIVADMMQQKTWLQGAAKYYYHVLKILASYRAKPFSFATGEDFRQKDLILLCIAKGSTFGGSFMLTPHAKLDSGRLHVCEIGDLKPLRRFLNIRKLETGRHDKLEVVKLYDAKTLRIEENPLLHAHIDGECFGKPPFEFEVLPKALHIRQLGKSASITS